MNEEALSSTEKECRWNEIVENNERSLERIRTRMPDTTISERSRTRNRSSELISDLKAFVLLVLFWFVLLFAVEFVI